MSKSSKFGLGVVFGAIAGAVTALLSAPKSGKETREELIEKFEVVGKKLTGSAKKDADATLEKANQLKDRVKKYIAEVKNGDENSDDLSLDDLKKELKDIETSATTFLKKAATKTVSEVKKRTSSAPKAKKPAAKK